MIIGKFEKKTENGKSIVRQRNPLNPYILRFGESNSNRALHYSKEEYKGDTLSRIVMNMFESQSNQKIKHRIQISNCHFELLEQSTLPNTFFQS